MPGKNPREGAGSERAWNLKEIEKLIDLLIAREITEFEMERDGLRIRIHRGRGSKGLTEAVEPYLEPMPEGPPAPPRPPSGPAESRAAAGEASSESTEGLHIIKSPIVGTFYSAASPNAPPFVKPGDVVEVGQVLCIIEAMKLMNEIESEATGEIVRVYVENGQPVEYGESLFAIKPSSKK